MATSNSRCPTCHRRHKRSNAANRAYWKLLHLIAGRPVRGVLYSADNWHRYFVSRFLGMEDYRLSNGITLLERRRTSELSVTEFSEYLTQVEAWAAEHDIYLADAEEIA